MIGLVLAAVAVVLWTEAGTRFAVGEALRRYDAAVPGAAQAGEIHGTLGGRLELVDLELRDGGDRPLLRIDHVAIELRLAALLGATVGFDTVAVDGLELHVGGEAARWGDLGPGGPAKEKPPGMVGPDLPIGFAGDLEVHAATILRHDAEGGLHTILGDTSLRAKLESAGRTATIRIDALSGLLGEPELAIAFAAGTVAWDDPRARIEELVLVSDRGLVRRLDVDLDCWTELAALRVSALVDPTQLVPRSPLPPIVALALELEGAGTLDGAWTSIHLEGGEDVRADLLLAGGLAPDLRLAGLGSVRAPLAGRGPLAALIAAGVERPRERPLVAGLVARSIDPRAPIVAVAEVRLDAQTELAAAAFVRDTHVQAHATVAEGALVAADATVAIPSLAELGDALRPWLELPALAGRVTARGRCDGAEGRLDCSTQLAGRSIALSGRRIDTAELGLDLSLRTGEPGVALRLRQLSLASGRLRLALLRPASIYVGPGSVGIHDLRLAFARGEVSANGRIGPSSALRVGIAHLDLAALAPLGLPVALRGQLDARARISGTLAAPRVGIAADVGRLHVDRHDLGRVGVELGYAGDEIATHLVWQPGDRQLAELRARVPVRGPGDPAGVGLRTHAPITARLRADRLDLAALQPFVGEHRVAGRMHAGVDVTGTAARPIVVAHVAGQHLRYDALALGDLDARARHDRDGVTAQVELAADWIDRLSVDVALPVRMGAVAPAFAIDRSAPAEVHARIEGAELYGLDPIAPGLALAGHLDGSVDLELHDGRIAGAANVLVRGLARDDAAIGTVALDARVDPEHLVADLQLSGGAARLLEAHVDVPVRLDVAAGELGWRRDQPLAMTAELADVDVAALARLAGTGGIAGRIDGTIDLHGVPATPVLSAALVARRMTYKRSRLGRLELAVDHDHGRVRAELRQHMGARGIDARIDVPIAVDLERRALDWDRDAAHHVTVRATAVDRELVMAAVELPDAAAFEANAELDAHGTPEDFRVRARVRAQLGDHAPGVPVALVLEADRARQRVELGIGPFADSELRAEAETRAPLGAWLAGAAPAWKEVPLQARVAADRFPLAELAALLPSVVSQPRGALDLQASAEGTLGAPVLRGQLGLDDAAITVVPLRQRFTAIDLRLALDQRDIVLEQLRARSAAGRAGARGRVHLARGGTRGRLDLDLDGLPIVRPGLPLMKLSTHATAVLDATGKVTDVDVVARNTTLDVFTASIEAPDRIPTSPHVTYVDARGRRRRASSTSAAKEPLLPPDMHVAIRVADVIIVRGPQADMTWRGAVEVERTDGKVHASGAIVADRGRLNFLGRDFTIDSGRITLPEQGDIDPYIALTAVTQTDAAAVTIDVHGRASRPELRLSSDPPMPESDVFALLVTGSAGAGEDADGSSVGAKAASLLAAFENPVLQRELQDSLGIDRVGLGFGDTVDQPIVAVGKRVSRKVYVETRYHHNAPIDENHAEVHVEYSIKAAWSVATFIGDRAKGAVELWWRKRFGKPRAPKADAGPPAGAPASSSASR